MYACWAYILQYPGSVTAGVYRAPGGKKAHGAPNPLENTWQLYYYHTQFASETSTKICISARSIAKLFSELWRRPLLVAPGGSFPSRHNCLLLWSSLI